jgi:hypothetical protein
VQNADQESAELVHHIVQAKIPIVLMFTFTEEDALPGELRSLLHGATRVQLNPFTEAQTAEYVAETLHRDKDYILPLVAVVQEKSHGNLFYIREILDTCTHDWVRSGGLLVWRLKLSVEHGLARHLLRIMSFYNRTVLIKCRVCSKQFCSLCT